MPYDNYCLAAQAGCRWRITSNWESLPGAVFDDIFQGYGKFFFDYEWAEHVVISLSNYRPRPLWAMGVDPKYRVEEI